MHVVSQHSLTRCLALLPVLLTFSCSIDEATYQEEFISLYCSTAGACESDHPLYMDESECLELGNAAVAISELAEASDTAGDQAGECVFNEDSAKECLKELRENQKENSISACNGLFGLEYGTMCDDIYTGEGCG